MADDEAMTREKFNDIASAHRRLLDEVIFNFHTYDWQHDEIFNHKRSWDRLTCSAIGIKKVIHSTFRDSRGTFI
jgi:hypothetical protein